MSLGLERDAPMGGPVDPLDQLAQTLRGMLDTLEATRTETESALDRQRELVRALSGVLEKLESLRAETEAAIEREYEFLLDAAHELRTPLTTVLTNLELLAEELEGEQAELVRAALRSTRRMRRLVGDLLLLSRADANRARPRRPVDLAEVLTDVAGELGPLAAGRELTVSAQRAVVLGMRDDLHRLVSNLIENALRHTPEGTHVRAITGERDGDAVVIVEDDGPGIQPELEHRVFERFTRGAGDGAAGSGLGLAIVRAVAGSHHGTVALERPASGRGARFVVRIPTSTQPPTMRATAGPGSAL
ncbi:MAG TPA: HAMP domain-containing sensor histidine kinase [Solirubrobacteraceae bacterium]|nr:HAMP domain-containing sensor histidine kinase [Solirubrobacteraceae bacterium]